MNCNDAVAALIDSLESGEAMTDAQREHIRSCERCRELLDSAKQFQTLLGRNGIEPPAVDGTLALAEEEVRATRTRRRTWIVAASIGVMVIAAVAAVLMRRSDIAPEFLFFGVAGAFVSVMIAIPIVLVFAIVRSANREGKQRLYKRLKPGRQLSGVCLGIAEATGVSVTLVRLAFVVLFFFNGIGFWLYILLDLAMPVHPADREYLWRFQAKKILAWFRGLGAR